MVILIPSLGEPPLPTNPRRSGRLRINSSASAHECNRGVVELSLGSWGEVTGEVKKVDDDSITLSCTKNIKIRLSPESIRSWRKVLHTGDIVAILVLDDAKSIRVRRILCDGKLLSSRHQRFDPETKRHSSRRRIR